MDLSAEIKNLLPRRLLWRSLLILMVPLWLLYEFGIIMLRIFPASKLAASRGRERDGETQRPPVGRSKAVLLPRRGRLEGAELPQGSHR